MFRLRSKLLYLTLFLSAALVGFEPPVFADTPGVDRPLRILHIMSFDSPWRWTDGQLAGFKEGLGDVQAEYQIFQMDIKHNNSVEAKEQKGAEARALIEHWRPDLVYTSDDAALSYVARHYAGQSLPFVFSGVNQALADHGVAGAPNVTGVLEQEHFQASVKLLQAIAPNVRRLAVITDEGAHWGPVIERIRQAMPQLADTRLVAVDRVPSFAAFQQKVKAYDGMADGVVYLGIFGLSDGADSNVPYQQVQRWVVENSRLPEISFWIDRVAHGVLASVTVSERQQGLAAGRLARAILVDGRSPAQLPVKPTVIGHPAISLARARQLNINVSSSLLLSSEVVTEFEWDRKTP